MTTHLLIGYPGIISSALLPRLLAWSPAERVVCLVEAADHQLASTQLEMLVAAGPAVADRVELLVGDVTEPWCGLDPDDPVLAQVSLVWHLAGIEDLSVDPRRAESVNVGGTREVLALCRSLTGLTRLHHVSTCYVSGAHEGVFTEDDLELGQTFRNHIEETRHRAEVLVREAMAGGLPVTVYRPGNVVGAARPSGTRAFDVALMVARLMLRQPRMALIPCVGDVDRVRLAVVPREYVVAAMERLALRPDSCGRTYTLVDPDPPTVRHIVDTFGALIGRRVVWVPLPLETTRGLVGSDPGLEDLLGIPGEALDYVAMPTEFDSAHATDDLAGSGITCPSFDDYAKDVLDAAQDASLAPAGSAR